MASLLRLVCVFSLVLSAYAAGAMPRAVWDVNLGAYLAAGGTLADLCAEGDVAEAHPECQACRLADSMSAAPKPFWVPVQSRVITPAGCLSPFPARPSAGAASPPPVRAPPFL